MTNDFRHLERDLRKSLFDMPLVITGPFILGEILRRNYTREVVGPRLGNFPRRKKSASAARTCSSK